MNTRYVSKKERDAAGYAAVRARFDREAEAFMLREADYFQVPGERLSLLEQFRRDREERTTR